MVSEKYFTRKFDVVPEWGIKYPNGKMLLCEFSTQDNYSRWGLIKNKLDRYAYSLKSIAQAFNATEAVLMFVIDIERLKVKEFIARNDVSDRILFTDYDTFKRVEIGGQLQAKIYFWRDGETYAISNF